MTMRLIIEDIDRFGQTTGFADHVRRKYTKFLYEFSEYLSLVVNQPFEAIDLERIYEYKDLSGLSIFGPLDATILDDFFSSISSKNYYHIVETRYALGSFFRYLERNHRFKNPIPFITFDFKVLKSDKRPNRSLTKHEILRLLHAIVSHSHELERDLLLFTLLLSTGCRISEIVNLRILNFDFTSSIFRIEKPKNKKERVGYLIDGMAVAIERYSKKNKLGAKDYLFKIDENRRLTKEAAQLLLHQYCKLGKIPSFTLHGTRHTFSTMMKEAGCDITTIQQMIGHEPNRFDTTEIYLDENVIRNRGIKIKENEELLHFLTTNIEKIDANRKK